MSAIVRLRVGVRVGWPFPNAGVVVIHVDSDFAVKLATAIGVVRDLLTQSGISDAVTLASRIVCEES